MKWKTCFNVLAACFLHEIAVPCHAAAPVLSAPDWTWPFFQFTVTGEFNATHVVERSTNLQAWTPVFTNSGASVSNRMLITAMGTKGYYRVAESSLPLFAFALAARSQIDFNGNNLRTDSFDSGDPNYSTAGLYDPLKNKEGGNVATPFGLTNSLSVGNARIMGRVSTGPGGSVSVGSAGSVGSKAWIQSGMTGIEPGWWTRDMTRHFPDLSAPSNSGAFTPTPGTVDGTNYQYVLASGRYLLSSLALGSSNKMRVIGQAVLHITGGISMAGTALIEISRGAALKLYVGGPSALIGGNGIVNNTGNATNFQYYGLPGNTSLSLSGSLFTGAIYAPSAGFTLSSGGSETYHFIGAVVARSVTVNGHCSVHFDENLLRARLSP